MNEAWLAFLEEASPGSGHRTHMTAIEFILQPVLFERFYVARGEHVLLALLMVVASGAHASLLDS